MNNEIITKGLLNLKRTRKDYHSLGNQEIYNSVLTAMIKELLELSTTLLNDMNNSESLPMPEDGMSIYEATVLIGCIISEHLFDELPKMYWSIVKEYWKLLFSKFDSPSNTTNQSTKLKRDILLKIRGYKNLLAIIQYNPKVMRLSIPYSAIYHLESSQKGEFVRDRDVPRTFYDWFSHASMRSWEWCNAINENGLDTYYEQQNQ